MNVLIVRLGALGDIVHAIPAAAALRAALPGARIDWLVEAKHRSILDLVTVLDRVVALEGRTLRAWTDAVRRARQARYDVAFDFQGLMKSAVLARASGASRVAGFSIWHLREKTARPFYSETDDTGDNEADTRHPEEPAPAAAGWRADAAHRVSARRLLLHARSTRSGAKLVLARSRSSIPAPRGPTSDGRLRGSGKWRRF